MGGQKKTLNNNAPLTPDQEPSIDLADVLSASVTTETIETVENVAEVTMAEEEFVITPEEPTASKETVAPQETLSEDSLEDVPITEEDVSLKIDTTATSVQGDAYADPSVSLPLTPALSQDSNATASGLDPVPGFQLVEAKGLTDTSAPDIPKSVLPERATASPIVKPPTSPMPSMDRFGSPSKPPPPPPKSQEDLMNPLSDMPKSKRFSQRMDYMITEFFSTVFQQKIKERLGAHWAHVTAQPEVDSAIAEIDSMWDLFEKMERMVERQRAALMHLTDVEAEVSLHFQQLGYYLLCEAIYFVSYNYSHTHTQNSFQDPESLTRDHLVDLGITYHEICKKRQVLVLAIDTFLHFVKNFRTKAIQDSVDTKNRQIGARQELDSYGSKVCCFFFFVSPFI